MRHTVRLLTPHAHVLLFYFSISYFLAWGLTLPLGKTLR
jgi:hypothetical protein